MTLGERLDRASARFPDKTAIAFKDYKLSYAQLHRTVERVAGFFVDAGLERGGRVGLLLDKSPECVIAFLGVARAGGVVFPVDCNQPMANIQYVLDLTRPSFLVAHGKFEPLLARLPFPADRVIFAGKRAEAPGRSWDEALAGPCVRLPDVSEDDSVYLNFTSGTTGLPKGAVTTHAHIDWNSKAVVDGYPMTPEDVHLCMFPVFVHPHEIFSRALYLGGTMVLIDSIYPKSIAAGVHEHRVTCILASAFIYESLLRSKESADLGSLRFLESGGMVTPPALIRGFRERFGLSIMPVWGSTEATGVALASTPGGPIKPGSVGKGLPPYEVKVIGDDGSETASGEIGEMILRGPGVCSLYLNNPEETVRHLRDGWFHTGDLVIRDEEGDILFTDRRSRMLKVAGIRVYPSEVEGVLTSHEDIAEAVVVRAVDSMHGEVPKAVIVLKEGAKLDKTDIRKFCEQRLAKPKVPRIVEFRTELPRTPGGKILWRQLEQ